MPYVLDTPPTAPTYDRYQIVSMLFEIPPEDITTLSVRVTYVNGYESGGDFIRGDDYRETMLSGAAVVSKMNELVTVGKTNYEQVKEAMWALVVAQDGLAAGSTS